MTALRKDAMDLMEQMPEVSGIYGTDTQPVKNKAFATLESLRRKVSDIDYDKELESYREEKYGTANIG